MGGKYFEILHAWKINFCSIAITDWKFDDFRILEIIFSWRNILFTLHFIEFCHNSGIFQFPTVLSWFLIVLCFHSILFQINSCFNDAIFSLISLRMLIIISWKFSSTAYIVSVFLWIAFICFFWSLSTWMFSSNVWGLLAANVYLWMKPLHTYWIFCVHGWALWLVGFPQVWWSRSPTFLWDDIQMTISVSLFHDPFELLLSRSSPISWQKV